MGDFYKDRTKKETEELYYLGIYLTKLNRTERKTKVWIATTLDIPLEHIVHAVDCYIWCVDMDYVNEFDWHRRNAHSYSSSKVVQKYFKLAGY